MKQGSRVSLVLQEQGTEVWLGTAPGNEAMDLLQWQKLEKMGSFQSSYVSDSIKHFGCPLQSSREIISKMGSSFDIRERERKRLVMGSQDSSCSHSQIQPLGECSSARQSRSYSMLSRDCRYMQNLVLPGCLTFFSNRSLTFFSFPNFIQFVFGFLRQVLTM